MRLGLDNTPFELRSQQGPWERSSLCALGRALFAVGATDSEQTAHELAWDLLGRVGDHAPVRVALADAGVDSAGVALALDAFHDRIAADADDHELAEFDRLLVEMPPRSRRGVINTGPVLSSTYNLAGEPT